MLLGVQLKERQFQEKDQQIKHVRKRHLSVLQQGAKHIKSGTVMAQDC